LWGHHPSLGPRRTKGLLAQLCARQRQGLIIAGTRDWIHARPNSLAQCMRCPPEPDRLTRRSPSGLQRGQALQTNGEKRLGSHLLQDRQAFLVAATRLSQITQRQRHVRQAEQWLDQSFPLPTSCTSTKLSSDHSSACATSPCKRRSWASRVSI